MSVANKCVDKGTKHYYLYDNDGNRIELEQSDGEKDIGVLESFVIFHVFFKVGTCLVALLCRFSIFSISPTLNGVQTASAYSI
jgi:hypothetical protein